MPTIQKIEFVFHSTLKNLSNDLFFFSLLKSVKPILVPIVWFDDEASITPEVHSQLSTLIISINICSYLKFIVPAISILSVAFSSAFIFVQVGFA
jgi:ABC-type multidrug transport system permease subunit